MNYYWSEKKMPQWQIKGRLFFSLSEIERIKAIEVLPMTVQNLVTLKK